MVTEAAFECACGQITGAAQNVPKGGLHLVCHCPSCRAGALHCGATLAQNEGVDLYLTPPHHVMLKTGADKLAPFAFNPKAIIRWKAACCGVQMFSAQANPRIAFMSVRTDRFVDPEAVGPVMTKSFVPRPNGKAGHDGKRALSALVLKAMMARLTGKWRLTPLFDARTAKPMVPVDQLSKETKAALLS